MFIIILLVSNSPDQNQTISDTQDHIAHGVCSHLTLVLQGTCKICSLSHVLCCHIPKLYKWLCKIFEPKYEQTKKFQQQRLHNHLVHARIWLFYELI